MLAELFICIGFFSTIIIFSAVIGSFLNSKNLIKTPEDEMEEVKETAKIKVSSTIHKSGRVA